MVRTNRIGNSRQPKTVKKITLKRELGVFGSFSIGFADVGADIYVALGLVIFFALGAAPLALAIAGIAYIFTALSYAELASTIPRAGGAAVFARESFGDFWGYVAGIGLLLDYIIDIALFSWFTMGYMGGFFHNLAAAGYTQFAPLALLNPEYAGGSYIYQALGTCIIILLLLGLNLLGIRESSRLNCTIIIINLASIALLFCVGFLFAWSLPVFIHNFGQLGTHITWSDFGWGITVAMVSYIGLESISEAAEETKHPGKIIPKSTLWLVVAVISVSVITSVLCAGLVPNDAISPGVYPSFSPYELGTTYQNNPVAGLAMGIGTHSFPVLKLVLPIFVGFLAFTMVTISANTGVIGSSRVTYSLGRYGLFPKWFDRIHPRFRVPHRTIIVFTLASLGFVIFAWFMGTYYGHIENPTIILADLYNYGALVAFMLVNLSLIRMRNKRPWLHRPWKSPGTLKISRRNKKPFEIPVLAVLGFSVCFTVWLLVLSLHQVGRIVGTIWFVAGIWLYMLYRLNKKLDLNKPVKPLVTELKEAHRLHPDIKKALRSRYAKVIEKLEMKEKEKGG